LEFMAMANAANIGREVGKVMEVHFITSLWVSCRKLLRLKIEIEVTQSLYFN